MKTAWFVDGYSKRPKLVQVVSRTEKSAVLIVPNDYGYPVHERRHMNPLLFDTFKAAKGYMIEDMKQRVRNAEANLDRSKAELKRVNDIPEPEASP